MTLAGPPDPAIPVWCLSDRRADPQNFTPHDESEAARARRFRRAEDRFDFLHSRAKARSLVASLEGVEESSVILSSFDDDGPEASGIPGLSVSWSRSGPFAAAAASRQLGVAIDIERLLPRDFRPMLAMIATEAERSALDGLGEADALTAFYRLWTAKEAVLKWRGKGLRDGAKSVSLPSEFLCAQSDHTLLIDSYGPVWIRIVASGPEVVCTLAFSGKTPI